MKVLHIGSSNKFTTQLFSFLGETFDLGNHLFLSYQTQIAWPDKYKEHYVEKNGYRFFIHLLQKGIASDKIILHCLPTGRYLFYFLLQPWLLKKCCWVIWGGDLYLQKESKKTFRWYKNEIVRKIVIKRIGHLITQIHGDYILAQRWYGAQGEWHECFMYPSNLYRDYPCQQSQHESLNIMVGNSADPSNNHLEALVKLRPYIDENIKIYCPLSYGNSDYADNVEKYGQALFGDKFIALREFMPFDKYIEFLAGIDIAIFNHKRQQGMGNTTTLLGLGKKVYMRSDVTSWGAFIRLGVQLYDVSSMNLKPIDQVTATNNRQIISDYFSEKNLIRRLEGILI